MLFQTSSEAQPFDEKHNNPQQLRFLIFKISINMDGTIPASPI